MARLGDCVTIVRKDGHRSVVPIGLWESSIKKDKDWKIESRPILDTPEMKLVRVVAEKPKAPEPVPVVVPVEPPKVEVAPAPVEQPKPIEVEKPKPKRKYKRKKKG